MLALPAPVLAAGTPKPAGHARKHRRHRPPPQARVAIDPATLTGTAIPDDFLGLSFEASELPTIAAYADGGNLVSLLRSLGPGMLRFGGISADTETAWQPTQTPPPAWAQSTITPEDLAGLAGVARASGWRVLLSVNLGHGEPALAAQEAQTAQAELGSSLAGIAIGNEPDRYLSDGLRLAGWTLASYLTEAETYRAAIAAAAPGVAIVGPDTSTGEPALPWLAGVAAATHPPLLTEHLYPLSSCTTPKPTLADLLSPLTRAHEAMLLGQVTAIAKQSGVPLRLDETNDISCRGQPGVSNVFASALWAVDYIARAMAAGVAGVNFHDLLAEPLGYSPLVSIDAQQAAGPLNANPEWYALLLTDRLLGDSPVQASVIGGERTLTVHAFLSPDGNLHLVLVNFTPAPAQPLTVRLRLPSPFGAGPILRLSAAGLRSTAGVLLGARGVGPSGVWDSPASLPRVAGTPGALKLTLAASSAALVTLYPAAGASGRSLKG